MTGVATNETNAGARTGDQSPQVATMQMRVLNEDGGERTFALVLDSGQDALGAVRDFATYQGIRAARFSAIGAFKRTTLGFYDVDERRYLEIPVDEQTEVLSLVGDVSVDQEGAVVVHAHTVLGMRDGTTRGGHLLHGVVRPTLEIVVVESPAELHRTFDPEVGLPIIDLGASR